MSEKLFNHPYGEYTMIRNEVFDAVMPLLSSDEWKMVCVALRHTLGEAPAGDAPGLSLADFVQRSGLQDLEAVQKALMTCVSAKFLTRFEDEQTSEALYALNNALSIEGFVNADEDEATADAEEAIPASIPADKARAYRQLIAFGEAMDAEPNVAVVEQAVLLNDTVAVLAWMRLGRDMEHLAQTDRFQAVMDRLMAQVPPVPEALAEVEAELEAEALAAAQAGTQAETDEEDVGPDLNTPEGLWQVALTVLETKMRSSLFKWVKDTTPVALENGVLTVAAVNKRTCDWLETGQMAGTIKKGFASVAGDVQLKFVVED